MAIFTGTAGNDSQNGTNGADSFDYSQGGKDTLSGKAGDDSFIMGAALGPTDKIDGGSGTDTVIISGDYSGGLTFAAATLVNVEILQLTAGNDYTLTLDNANATLGQSLRIDGSALGAGDSLVFDGSTETSSSLEILCGAGNDLVFAGGGDDVIRGGASFSASDTINGGSGRDRLELNGNYSAGLAFASGTIRGIEKISVAAGNDYNLTLHNAALEFGEALTIDGGALGAADNLILNAAAITVGRVQIIGGGAADTISIGQSGEDVVKSGGGGDTIAAGANLTDTIRLNGGGGSDTLTLSGDYSDRLQLLANTMRSIETITFASGAGDYNIATVDQTVASGAMLTVNASALGAAQTLTFDGSAESNGRFTFLAGAGDHDLTGGGGDDTFLMGAAMTDSTPIDGGSGIDTIDLNGDYSSELVLSAMVHVERVVLGAGFDYWLTFDSATVAAGQQLTIDATALTATDSVIIDADEVQSSAVVFQFAGGFTAGDFLEGGQSYNRLVLDGDYSSGLTFSESTMQRIDEISLTAGNRYSLTLAEGNVAPNGLLLIDGSTLGSGDTFQFDGEAETDGFLVVRGGAGDDVLSGGDFGTQLLGNDGNDELYASLQFNQIFGGDGNDTIIYDPDSGLDDDVLDTIDGGDGTDEVILDNDFVGEFLATTSVEIVTLEAGLSFALTVGSDVGTTYDGGSASDVFIDASFCTTDLVLIGSAIGINGLVGGSGDDAISGGSDDDQLHGGGGADTQYGAGGLDRYFFPGGVADSTSTGYDTLLLLEFDSDFFHMSFVPTAINTAVATGSLSTATFDANLAAVIDGTKLGIDNALLYAPNAGTLSGRTFLIVNINGVAGYQASEDYVIDVTGFSGTLTTTDFSF